MAKVTLRHRSMSKNRLSLFLDYYPPIQNPQNGKLIRKEYLKLYLYEKPKGDLEKNHNKQTSILADTIKAKRQLSIQEAKYGFISDSQRNGDFIEYFKLLQKKRKGSNADNWASTLKYLERFTGGKIRFSDISVKWCNDLKDFLQSAKSTKSAKVTLATNSASSYFNKVKHVLKEAFREGFIADDVSKSVKSIKAEETSRQYLTQEELQKLVFADCEVLVLKQAGLFSALTGLRFSDLKQIKWSDIGHSELQGGYFLTFRQKKTKGVEFLPITDDAIALLGVVPENVEELVFKGLTYSSQLKPYLSKWLASGGICKKITFHSFRHTFATLQLSHGTDIYTVSKLLGHRELKTTQIYAKVIDQTKRKAVNSIKLKL